MCTVWSEDACFACALNRGYHILFLLLSPRCSVLSGHSKKKKKIGFQDRLSLNAGQKYCRMLQKSNLQYFRSSLSYHLSLRHLFCLFFSGGLRQVYCTVKIKNYCCILDLIGAPSVSFSKFYTLFRKAVLILIS